MFLVDANLNNFLIFLRLKIFSFHKRELKFFRYFPVFTYGLSHNLLMCYIAQTDFMMLNHLWISDTNSTWSDYIYLHLLDLMCHNFSRFSHHNSLDKWAVNFLFENALVWFRQGLNLKNIQATPPAQLQKNKWSNQKMGQRTKQTLLQGRHTDG